MTNENTQSPALAAMMAHLTMPRQYADIMQDHVLRMNEVCKVTVYRITK